MSHPSNQPSESEPSVADLFLNHPYTFCFLKNAIMGPRHQMIPSSFPVPFASTPADTSPLLPVITSSPPHIRLDFGFGELPLKVSQVVQLLKHFLEKLVIAHPELGDEGVMTRYLSGVFKEREGGEEGNERLMRVIVLGEGGSESSRGEEVGGSTSADLGVGGRFEESNANAHAGTRGERNRTRPWDGERSSEGIHVGPGAGGRFGRFEANNANINARASTREESSRTRPWDGGRSSGSTDESPDRVDGSKKRPWDGGEISERVLVSSGVSGCWQRDDANANTNTHASTSDTTHLDTPVSIIHVDSHRLGGRNSFGASSSSSGSASASNTTHLPIINTHSDRPIPAGPSGLSPGPSQVPSVSTPSMPETFTARVNLSDTEGIITPLPSPFSYIWNQRPSFNFTPSTPRPAPSKPNPAPTMPRFKFRAPTTPSMARRGYSAPNPAPASTHKSMRGRTKTPEPPMAMLEPPPAPPMAVLRPPPTHPRAIQTPRRPRAMRTPTQPRTMQAHVHPRIPVRPPPPRATPTPTQTPSQPPPHAHHRPLHPATEARRHVMVLSEARAPYYFGTPCVSNCCGTDEAAASGADEVGVGEVELSTGPSVRGTLTGPGVAGSSLYPASRLSPISRTVHTPRWAPRVRVGSPLAKSSFGSSDKDDTKGRGVQNDAVVGSMNSSRTADAVDSRGRVMSSLGPNRTVHTPRSLRVQATLASSNIIPSNVTNNRARAHDQNEAPIESMRSITTSSASAVDNCAGRGVPFRVQNQTRSEALPLASPSNIVNVVPSSTPRAEGPHHQYNLPRPLQPPILHTKSPVLPLKPSAFRTTPPILPLAPPILPLAPPILPLAPPILPPKAPILPPKIPSLPPKHPILPPQPSTPSPTPSTRPLLKPIKLNIVDASDYPCHIRCGIKCQWKHARGVCGEAFLRRGIFEAHLRVVHGVPFAVVNEPANPQPEGVIDLEEGEILEDEDKNEQRAATSVPANSRCLWAGCTHPTMPSGPEFDSHIKSHYLFTFCHRPDCQSIIDDQRADTHRLSKSSESGSKHIDKLLNPNMCANTDLVLMLYDKNEEETRMGARFDAELRKVGREYYTKHEGWIRCEFERGAQAEVDGDGC